RLPKSGDFGYGKLRGLRALILLAAILLATLAGCGRAVDPSVVDPYEVLREKLAQPVSVDWDNVPLKNALKELAEQSGLAIRLNVTKLGEANLVPEYPVTLHLRGVRLRSALHELLHGLGANYVPSDDGIIVTSKEQ